MSAEEYSTYTYEKIITDLLNDGVRHIKIRDGQLTTCCPFHQENNPSFGINLKTGLYNCFSCGEKGNIVQFVSKMKHIPIPEAIKYLGSQGYDIGNGKSYNYYTLEKYADEKKLDIEYLREKLYLDTAPDGKSVRIPYFNQDGTQIAIRHRNHPDSKTRFWWSNGTKASLYGLDLIDRFPSEYVILVEGESDCHCAWCNDIYTIGVPGAKNFKEKDANLFDHFQKIYIHQEPDNGGAEFVRKICQYLPPEKLYTICAFDVDDECKDLADLHKKGKLNLDNLMAVAQKIPQIYFNEINRKIDDAEHVSIAKQVLTELSIKFYKGNFYVYMDGVYKEGLAKIEKCILDIDRNIKKNIRTEILDYLRIMEGVEVAYIDTNLINFKNGIYHIDTNTLEPHNTDIFTICQINAEYLTDEELDKLKENSGGKYIDKFLEDVCCGHQDRIDTLFEFTGYSMTYSVKLQKCLFLLGETADNGKSTYLELTETLFGEKNCCSISISEFGERFFGAELQDKLLNTVHEVENIQLKDLKNFKTVITGNELSVEQKYKDRYKLKPFTHHIFAMNSLPELINGGDEGFFRRVQIIPFEAKFSDEEKEAFNFDELVTQNSLNYYANTSLRKFQAMVQKGNRRFSNYKESIELIEGYKFEDNSAQIFLNNVILYIQKIDINNKILIKELYELYRQWCISNNFPILSNKIFKNTALSCGKFEKAPLKNGYPCLAFMGDLDFSNQTYNNINSTRKTLRKNDYFRDYMDF